MVKGGQIHWLKGHLQPLVYVTVMVLLLLMASNRHLVYGGYENMLYNSLRPLYGDEPVSFHGELRFYSNGSSEVARLMEIPVVLEGEIFLKEGIGHMDFLVSRAGEKVGIGCIELAENHIVVKSSDTEVWQSEQIDLFEVFREANIREIYGQLEVIEIRGNDMGKDVIGYRLDLTDIVNSESLALLEKSTGISGDRIESTFSIEVDMRGRLSAVKLEAGFGEWQVDGELRLKQISL